MSEEREISRVNFAVNEAAEAIVHRNGIEITVGTTHSNLRSIGALSLRDAEGTVVATSPLTHCAHRSALLCLSLDV